MNRTRTPVPEPWQQEVIDAVQQYTMTSAENILAMINSVQYVVKNNIDGSIVECGVWKGGSMMAAAFTLAHLKKTDRTLYLYDTFDTFSKPGLADISHDGKHGDEILTSLAEDGTSWKSANMDEVKRNMSQIGYPMELVHFVKGEVEKTIPGTIPGKISLLRLDTDWYASTKHELEWLYPRLSQGGVLIIDDYGYWKGCKKAVDEYFSNKQVIPKLKKIDFSARIMYKD